MAARKQKARKTSSKKSELPPSNPPLLKGDPIFYNHHWNPLGITKSWLPTTTRCGAAAPQLYQVVHVIDDSYTNPDPYPNKHFLGDTTSIAEAAIEMPHASHWCVLKSDLTAKTHPPPSTTSDLLGPSLQVNGVSLSSNSRSAVVVSYTVCLSECSYVYSRYRHVSIRYECTTADPFDPKRKLIEFTSLVRSEGKFYAMSLQGALVVMEVSGTRLKITGVSASRAVPSMSCRFFKEYLVEMKKEILLVFLIHEKSLAVADGVEVFRLDVVKLDWIKAEKLPENTIVSLSDRCVGVESEEYGCRDRVFFSLESENVWRVYDMKTGCISLD